MRSVRRSDADYLQLLASETEAVLVFGDTVEDCNARALLLLRCKRADIVGQPVQRCLPPQQPDGTASNDGLRLRIEAARPGLPQWFSWQFRCPDGLAVETLVQLELVELDGQPRCVARLSDLSRLWHAEQALQETELRLRQILEHSPTVVFVKDTEGRYLFVNQRFREVFPAAGGGHAVRDTDVFPPQVVDHLRAADRRVLETRSAVEIEEDLIVGGKECTYLAVKFPLLDSKREPYAVCGIATDISARKRIERALRSAALAVSSEEGDAVFQELTRYLATTLGLDGAFIAQCTDSESRSVRTLAVYADRDFEENIEYALSGTVCGTVVGKEFRFIPANVRQLYPEDPMFRRLSIQGYAAYPLNDSEGHPLGLIAAISRHPMGNSALTESMLKIFAARAAAEIERRRANEDLRAREERYRAIFNAAADAVVLRDADFRIVDVNPAYSAISGYEREEVVGTTRVIAEPLGAGGSLAELHRRALAGESVQVEALGSRKDGTEIYIEQRLVPIIHEGKPHVLHIGRDITARKRAEAERARLEAQLRQAQKMEAIGHLTGGIAHDFNNILSSIMGYVVLSLERQADLGDVKLGRYLEKIHLAAARARDIIQQMLTFSRGQRGEPRPLSLPRLLKESVKLLRSTLPSSVELLTDLDGSTPPVLLDPVQVDQMLLNLCINARDAMASSGTIGVSVRVGPELDRTCASCRKPVQGRLVELAVRDTGSGIAPEVMERMFEPFFSTKQTGKGSGMGLSTVHGIVHEHGGHIVVDSTLGAGTVFRVLFSPLPEEHGAKRVRSQKRSSARRPKRPLAGRVLVVDDEEMVGQFMSDLLENWGLEVVVKTSPLDARTIFEADPGRFDLVVTDQTMPRITGVELAQHLLAVRPGLPVILYTGFADTLTSEQVQRCGVRALMTKPLEPGALFSVLSANLPKLPAAGD